jgi:hypothetical protein
VTLHEQDFPRIQDRIGERKRSFYIDPEKSGDPGRGDSLQGLSGQPEWFSWRGQPPGGVSMEYVIDVTL